MNIPWIVAIVLCIAVIVAGVRGVRDGRPWRSARIALQLAAAGLLYCLLFPPTTSESFSADELTVLTPGATAAQIAGIGAVGTVVALPGVEVARGVERVPDLGTALRRHPQTRSLRIVGGGLPARDRDAASGLAIHFDAAPAPRGLVELDLPRQVGVGSVWRLVGRVEGAADGAVELRDPAGAVAAHSPLDAKGHFALRAQAKSAGEALFTLQVRDGDAQLIDSVPVPVFAQQAPPMRVLLLAGAPDPDLKYLRRWAVDSGAHLDSRTTLTEGVALTEGALALDAAALREADIAIIDERAWMALDGPRKQILDAAVREGLGLLLRVTGPLPAPVADDWTARGFRMQPRDSSTAVVLDKTLGLDSSGLRFRSEPLSVDAADATPLLRTDDGIPVALWRTEGRGRVGVWWLADSWRLVLAGERSRHATLWAESIAMLARARDESVPSLPDDARVNERAVMCGLGPDAAVEADNGERTALVVEKSPLQSGCAAYWPTQPGWHTLLAAGKRWPFHVRSADEATTLLAAGNARATRALAGAKKPSSETTTRPVPLPRWPFFAAWLAVIALLWLVERRAAYSVR